MDNYFDLNEKNSDCKKIYQAPYVIKLLENGEPIMGSPVIGQIEASGGVFGGS